MRERVGLAWLAHASFCSGSNWRVCSGATRLDLWRAQIFDDVSTGRMYSYLNSLTHSIDLPTETISRRHLFFGRLGRVGRTHHGW